MNTSQNGSSSRERRHFSAEQKVAIVKRHLLEGGNKRDTTGCVENSPC
jgi:transposase-like protein